MKAEKSPGSELIPNIVWTEFAFELSLFLLTYTTPHLNRVPAQLKQAIVVPVPQCGPPMSVESDLRPVSSTLPVAKVLEGFSAKSLLMCVWDKLDSKQFALPGKQLALRRPWSIYFTQFWSQLMVVRCMVLKGKKCKEMCVSFLQYSPFPPAPPLVGSSLIEKVSC